MAGLRGLRVFTGVFARLRHGLRWFTCVYVVSPAFLHILGSQNAFLVCLRDLTGVFDRLRRRRPLENHVGDSFQGNTSLWRPFSWGGYSCRRLDSGLRWPCSRVLTWVFAPFWKIEAVAGTSFLTCLRGLTGVFAHLFGK